MEGQNGTPRLLAIEAIRAQRIEAAALLAVGIIHDLNNLLTVIAGSFDLLAEEGGQPDSGYVDDGRRASARARELTGRLMALASGERSWRAVPVNMVVAETAGLVRIVARGARIDLDLAPQEVLAFGDESQIRQVVTNLVLNACQASEPDRGPVVLATRREGRKVCIEVADRGTGIEAEELERLFTPLASARDGGHGIGLAAVHAIVELHGGEIEVSTAPGTGTRFRVRLPTVEE